jgi:hypothetical protein
MTPVYLAGTPNVAPGTDLGDDVGINPLGVQEQAE